VLDPLRRDARGRRLGRWLGGLALALSFAFIGVRLWQGGAWDLVRPRLELLLLATLAGALLYGLSGFLLSAAWRQILAIERPPGPAARYHAVYGRTQIAKYLPGNCFHFVGRQVLGRALAHSQAALALASLLEAVLLVAVAMSLALPLALARLGAWSLILLAGAAAAFALTFAAPRLLPARFGRGAGSSADRSVALPAARLLRAVPLYVAFFATAGGLLWLLAAAAAGSSPAGAPGPLTCVGALALAWAAGFVVPGAAAGIGVREAVLMIALDGALAPEAGAAVALALRLVTTAGDGIFCGLALALPLPPSSPAAQVSK
jgi:hypothetical protein